MGLVSAYKTYKNSQNAKYLHSVQTDLLAGMDIDDSSPIMVINLNTNKTKKGTTNMTKESLLQVENPNIEQQIVLNMIEQKTQVLDISDVMHAVTDDIVEKLESKGYIIEITNGTLSTDFDTDLINIQFLVDDFNDDLTCNNIPVAARVRNYILHEQLIVMDATLDKIENNLNIKPSVSVQKEDVENIDVFKAALSVMELEIVKEFKNHYRIRKIKA